MKIGKLCVWISMVSALVGVAVSIYIDNQARATTDALMAIFGMLLLTNYYGVRANEP